MTLPTVAFCGWGRCGKDTAGEFLGTVTPLKYSGSLSWTMIGIMADRLKVCPQVAWERRHENRKIWYDTCNEFRAHDPARIIRNSLNNGEIVCGIRDKLELRTAIQEGLLTHVVWIDRDGIPRDTTVTYESGDCNHILGNHGTIEDFQQTLIRWAEGVGIPFLHNFKNRN